MSCYGRARRANEQDDVLDRRERDEDDSDEDFDREMEKKSYERGKLRDLHAEVLARER